LHHGAIRAQNTKCYVDPDENGVSPWPTVGLARVDAPLGGDDKTAELAVVILIVGSFGTLTEWFGRIVHSTDHSVAVEDEGNTEIVPTGFASKVDKGQAVPPEPVPEVLKGRPWLKTPHLRKLLQQLLNSDLTLQSCQLIPDAEVRTSAEREMRITHPLQVQPLWLSKLCGVSIRSPQHKKDQLACA
jgi:hypothetical protein